VKKVIAAAMIAYAAISSYSAHAAGLQPTTYGNSDTMIGSGGDTYLINMRNVTKLDIGPNHLRLFVMNENFQHPRFVAGVRTNLAEYTYAASCRSDGYLFPLRVAALSNEGDVLTSIQFRDGAYFVARPNSDLAKVREHVCAAPLQ